MTTLVICALALCVAACGKQPQQIRALMEVRFDPKAPRANRVSLTNINTASAADLEKLPGVGKVMAERIIAHREEYGLFRRPEHLMMVRGISDRKFRVIRPLLTVADLPAGGQ